MPILVNCPSCERTLRVPDTLLGQKVKCPSCATNFDALPSQEETLQAPPSDAIVEKKEDSPPVPAPPSSSKTKRASGSQPRMCPFCAEPVPAEARRCPHCDESLENLEKHDEDEDEDDEGDERPWDYGGVRRDAEPHRGALILTLGIIGLVMLGFCAPVGLVLGVMAWIMGGHDLKKMRERSMDPSGLGTTQAGWICGIIGTILDGLASLFCVGYFVFVFAMVFSAARMTPPRPPVSAPPAPVIKQNGPPNQNGGMKKDGPMKKLEPVKPGPKQPKAKDKQPDA